MNWLTTKLYGYRRFFAAGVEKPERSFVNFVSGALVVDNPVTKTTDVTIDESTVLVSATNLATPNTVVKRSAGASANFGGTCHFGAIDVATSINAESAIISKTLEVDDSLSVGSDVNCSGVVVGTNGLYTDNTVTCNDISVAADINCGGSGLFNGGVSCIALATGIANCTGVNCSGPGSFTGAVSVGSLTSGADVTCAPGSSFKLGSTRTYTRIAGSTPVMDPAHWTYSTGVDLISLGVGSRLHVPLSQLPPGATLTSISVRVASLSPHTLPLPTTKRSVSLVYITASTGAQVALWTTFDPGTTVAAYDGSHPIVATGAPITFNQALVAAYIQFVDESGANSISGNTIFYAADFTYTMDRVVGT
jgi:hypothetical protein